MSRKVNRAPDGLTVNLGNSSSGTPVNLFFPFLDRRADLGLVGRRKYAPFLLEFWIPEVGMVFYVPRWESLN